MNLNDALAPFLSGGLSGQCDTSQARTHTHVAFLSEHPDRTAAIQQVLTSDRYRLTQVSSIALMEKAIEKRICDVAIVDIERQDEWPSSVFSRFDELAANFPVIAICKKNLEILNYRQKAQHVAEVVSYDAIGDLRFLSLIDAAVFRSEIIRNIDIVDDQDWSPTSAGWSS